MINQSRQGVILKVKIQPGARRNAIVGQLGDALKLAVVAPPTHGRANDACIELLAELLKQPRSAITIVSGQRSRNKAIHITGISANEVRLRLGIPGHRDIADVGL